MSEALYERYKDALRRGHVAALRGRHDVALDAYGEASRLAPDRALPYVGIAGVLTRLGHDTEAPGRLRRGPGPGSRRRGRPARPGRPPGARPATASARPRRWTASRPRSMVPAGSPTPPMRPGARWSWPNRAVGASTVRQLAERLRAESSDPAASEALASAMRLLAGPAVTPEASRPAEADAETEAAGMAADEAVAAATIASTTAAATGAAVPAGRRDRRRRGGRRRRRPTRDPVARADGRRRPSGGRGERGGHRRLLHRAGRQSGRPGPAPGPRRPVPRSRLADDRGRQAGAAGAAGRPDR